MMKGPTRVHPSRVKNAYPAKIFRRRDIAATLANNRRFLRRRSSADCSKIGTGLADFRFGSWSCKNTSPRRALRSRDGSVSGRDRGHQRLGPDDVHGPCQVIGQDRESHIGGYFWKRLVRKCVAPMRAFIVPNGCSTVSRRTRIACGLASRRCSQLRADAHAPIAESSALALSCTAI